MATGRVLGTPIVFERVESSPKRKKPRLKELDRLERHLYRAASRSANATSKGVDRYNKERKKSAKRERDGALIDVMPNLARGGAVSAARLAPVPLDLMRAGFTPSLRRATRRSVRMTARMFEGS